MQTVITMLNDASEKFGNMPYLSQKEDSGWVSLSFKQAKEEAENFALSLIKRGFMKSEAITILAEGRNNWITGEFGILMAGCVSVPITIKLMPGEIPFRLNHSESKAILVTENTLDKFLSVMEDLDHKPLVVLLSNYRKSADETANKYGYEIGREIVHFDDMIKEGAAARGEFQKELDKRVADISEDDTVTISYTSGTTGNPKGIMLTHKNYWVNSHDADETLPLPIGVSILIMLPLDHSFAHTVGLYVGLLRGLSLSFVDARKGGLSTLRNIPVNLKERNSYFTLTVPAITGNFMKKMMAGVAEKGGLINKIFLKSLECGIAYYGDGNEKIPFSTKLKCFFPYKLASILIFPNLRKVFGDEIKFCVGGGALLEVKQQKFFNAIGVPVYQGYGLTEAAPIICTNTPKKHKFGTSGVILPSIETKIMKSDTEEAPPGVTGELVIRGGNVMKGYFKNEEETAKALRDGWLWTGDLGYKDPDGFLVIVGRAKALLIASDGEKYSPEEIEEAVINNSTVVNQIMAYNEQRKFTTALVTLNESEVKSIIKRDGLTEVDQVLKAIYESLYSFKNNNCTIPSQWIPHTMSILKEPFSEEQKLINSTMKLVRFKVAEFYKDRIEAMYGEESEFFNDGNRAVVKELFDL
ncbi:MAG: AMP-binding protein [Spirochaetales bacterium]|nr:AMP-binding protein [Spirochaetales bacterium]